jgi:hypothetical protein
MARGNQLATCGGVRVAVGSGRRRGAARRIGGCRAGAEEREGERKKRPGSFLTTTWCSEDGQSMAGGSEAMVRLLGLGRKEATAWGKRGLGFGRHL